jgi:hypothetical protein
MSLLKKLWKFILELIAIILYVLRYLLGKSKDRECECPPPLQKPDPFLYCQYYLMSLGFPVTWDNPDIFIFQGATLVDPHDLKASTLYTVVARIWNSSTSVPVMNLPVNFSYLSFGMGVHSNPISSTAVDLNVKGLPGCPAFAYIPWTTPATLGHYCIQVLLSPPDDSNWLNNLGQRNTDVVQPASPATFQFMVGNNRDDRARTIQFTIDTYSIPPLIPCDLHISSAGNNRGIDKSAPPVPPGWTVTLTPSQLQLAPGEEQQVTAQITPPAGYTGTMPFNVTGSDEVGPIGGVTLNVEVL